LDDLPPRGLPIPKPPGRREQVITDALKQLEEDLAEDHDKAEETIEKYGLTIEVARLREKLARGATTELQRLLLSTPGVAEKLFNEAVEKQLKDAEEEEEGDDEDDVKDDSVRLIVSQLGEVVQALQKLVPADPKGGDGDDPDGVPASPGSGGSPSPVMATAGPEAADEAAPAGQPKPSGTRTSSKVKKS